jgi:hypothetical protein
LHIYTYSNFCKSAISALEFNLLFSSLIRIINSSLSYLNFSSIIADISSLVARPSNYFFISFILDLLPSTLLNSNSFSKLHLFSLNRFILWAITVQWKFDLIANFIFFSQIRLFLKWQWRCVNYNSFESFWFP